MVDSRVQSFGMHRSPNIVEIVASPALLQVELVLEIWHPFEAPRSAVLDDLKRSAEAEGGPREGDHKGVSHLSSG